MATNEEVHCISSIFKFLIYENICENLGADSINTIEIYRIDEI